MTHTGDLRAEKNLTCRVSLLPSMSPPRGLPWVQTPTGSPQGANAYLSVYLGVCPSHGLAGANMVLRSLSPATRARPQSGRSRDPSEQAALGGGGCWAEWGRRETLTPRFGTGLITALPAPRAPTVPPPLTQSHRPPARGLAREAGSRALCPGLGHSTASHVQPAPESGGGRAERVLSQPGRNTETFSQNSESVIIRERDKRTLKFVCENQL